MWIKLARKKQFVLTQSGILFCISMLFTLLISLILLNTSIESNTNSIPSIQESSSNISASQNTSSMATSRR
ncbi:MAG: hypothetical protein ACPGTQ_12800 [Colwellia sp.]